MPNSFAMLAPCECFNYVQVKFYINGPREEDSLNRVFSWRNDDDAIAPAWILGPSQNLLTTFETKFNL